MYTMENALFIFALLFYAGLCLIFYIVFCKLKEKFAIMATRIIALERKFEEAWKRNFSFPNEVEWMEVSRSYTEPLMDMDAGLFGSTTISCDDPERVKELTNGATHILLRNMKTGEYKSETILGIHKLNKELDFK